MKTFRCRITKVVFLSITALALSIGAGVTLIKFKSQQEANSRCIAKDFEELEKLDIKPIFDENSQSCTIECPPGTPFCG